MNLSWSVLLYIVQFFNPICIYIPFLIWFGRAFFNNFSYCEALENIVAPITHYVAVRNGASEFKLMGHWKVIR